jgi:hypothetical protein
MTRERLEELLREIPTPQSTRARELAVAQARAEIAGRATSARSTHPDRRRLLALAAAILVVVVALLTPPGRAASAWVGELVGIGEVGGSPTQDERVFDDEGSAVVIDNGRAPDGSRYEWVAYRCEVDLEEEGLPTRFKGIGLSFEWPGVEGHETGGSCEEGTGRSPDAGVLSSRGVDALPSQSTGVAKPDLVVSGSTGPRVHRLRVVYTDAQGQKHDLPVDFARTEGKLRRLAHRSEPLGTFVAFIPGDWAARDELQSRLDLRPLDGTGKLELGPIARRERTLARRAFAACEHLQRECLEERMPPSPIEYIAYDEQGQELERESEPTAATVLRGPRAREAAGRERPEDKRWRRPTQPEAVGEPVVLLSGRAPDGALYEVYVERFERNGESRGHCEQLWWPYVPEEGSGGSCGPGIPPTSAFGRRDPEKVAAKPFGFPTYASAATKHRVLRGYARSHVSRVRVVYRDEDGVRRDAPVELTRVRGQLQARIEASQPFGIFVAFVPPDADPRAAIEVLAYDESGEQVGRDRTARSVP